MTLSDVLDAVQKLLAANDLAPHGLAEDVLPDRAAQAVCDVVRDPQLRPEHRRRIYDDLVANRAYLERHPDPRLVDLIWWGEHVERLYKSLRGKKLSTFHFARAFEATCRRCGIDLLPAMGRLEEVARAWSGREYQRAVELFSAHLVEIEPPGEAADELGAQA